MDKLGPTLIIIAVVIVVFGAMWWGWRRRARRDAALQPTQAIPSELGAVHAELDVQYVATTEHAKPLERLAIRGLSFRGTAHLTLADAGIVLGVTGEHDVFIPASTIQSVDTTNVTIDRVVETGGLVRIAWRINTAMGTGSGPVVDSYLRTIEPSDRTTLLDGVHAIAPHTTESNASDSPDTESEM